MKKDEERKIRRVEQLVIRKGSKYKKMYKFLDKLCFYSKNHYNMINYEMRKLFLGNGCKADEIPSFFDKQAEFCKLGDTQALIGSRATQDITKSCMETWKSFKKTTLEFEKDSEKYCKKRGIDKGLLEKTNENGIPLCKPKMPKYLDKEKGRYIFTINGGCFKPLDDDMFVCSVKILNNLYESITGEDKFCFVSYRRRIEGDNVKLNQIRVVPKADAYVIEMIYEIKVDADLEYESKYRTKEERNEQAKEDIADRAVAIKLGVNDFITVVNNFGESPFIMDGDAFKPFIDTYLNKRAELTSIATTVNGVHTTRRLQRLSNKITRQTKYIANMYSKFVVDWCKEHDVQEVILSKTKGMKQGLHSKYAGLIPTAICESQLIYKLEEAGINVKDVSSASTKSTSFLDLEPVDKKYENKERVKDGIFTTNRGTKINSSVNTTYQMMRKRHENAFTADSVKNAKIEPVLYTVENSNCLKIVIK